MEVVELLKRACHVLLDQVLHLLLRRRLFVLVSFNWREWVEVLLLLCNCYQAHTALELGPLCAGGARLTNPPLLERITFQACLNGKQTEEDAPSKRA